MSCYKSFFADSDSDGDLASVLGVIKIEPLQADLSVPSKKAINENSETHHWIHSPLADLDFDTSLYDRHKVFFPEKERKAILNKAKEEIESCKISKAVFARKVLDRSIGILNNVFRYHGKGYEQHVQTIKNFFETVPFEERYHMYTGRKPAQTITTMSKNVGGISVLPNKHRIQSSTPSVLHEKDDKSKIIFRTSAGKSAEMASKSLISFSSSPVNVEPKHNNDSNETLKHNTGKLNKSLSLIQMSVPIPLTKLIELPGKDAVQILIKEVTTKMPMRYAKTYTIPDYMKGNPVIVIPCAAKRELDKAIEERVIKPTDDACKHLAKKLKLNLRAVQVYAHHAQPEIFNANLNQLD